MGNWTDLEDLAGKSLRIITNNGRDGIVQSKLWKELDLSSRDGSRVAMSLEKRSLIKRVKFFANGRWTYRLLPTKLPISMDCIESAPCLSCPVEHMCSTDSPYSPHNCDLVEDWITISFQDRVQIKPKIRDNMRQESEVVQSEKPKRSKILSKVAKNNRKYKKRSMRRRHRKNES
jgi:hypothetical protein